MSGSANRYAIAVEAAKTASKIANDASEKAKAEKTADAHNAAATAHRSASTMHGEAYLSAPPVIGKVIGEHLREGNKHDRAAIKHSGAAERARDDHGRFA